MNQRRRNNCYCRHSLHFLTCSVFIQQMFPIRVSATPLLPTRYSPIFKRVSEIITYLWYSKQTFQCSFSYYVYTVNIAMKSFV
jgi:hypothetical protein